MYETTTTNKTKVKVRATTGTQVVSLQLKKPDTSSKFWGNSTLCAAKFRF